MAESPDDAQAAALAAIQALSADYLANLPAKLEQIEQLWRSARDQGWPSDVLADLHRSVHGVTGSGRVFGLPTVSEAARSLELDLQAVLESKAPATPERSDRIAQGLQSLRKIAQAAGQQA